MTTPHLRNRRSARPVGRIVLASALALGAVASAATGAEAATGAHHSQSPAWARPGAAHPIPFTAATVTRNSNGSYTVSWAATGLDRVTVYAGSTEQNIDYRHAVAHGKGTDSVTVTVSGKADRQWFRLVPSRGEGLTLADRSLHLASAPNFRDAGGYRTADGSWVKMGVVYRTGDISKLTGADLAELQRLGIHTIYDLRTDSEVAASPDQVPAGAKDIRENVLGAADTGSFSSTSAAESVQIMQQAEVTMVDSASAQTAYHDVLTGIATGRNLNVVYHCTAGKDRTGWASAALLTALGVPEQTVLADYLASNDYNAASNAATLASLPAAYAAVYKPLLAVDPSYLNSGFTEVQKQYGSFGGYLKKGLDLDSRTLAELRARLLVG